MEYIYEICILVFFAVALYYHGKYMYNNGLQDGSEGTLTILEHQGIIKINDKDEIKGVQSDQFVV